MISTTGKDLSEENKYETRVFEGKAYRGLSDQESWIKNSYDINLDKEFKKYSKKFDRLNKAIEYHKKLLSHFILEEEL
ncbi:MAG: hypothetical protein BTN85_1042 [Candidatus Methanohalarchaeum thermophilum]|uniref:Uncharacterized protein n=1 Tax=Methanohalarchaeum thermophilum TaxID=1903181 RepID=A0A1Q6DW23_METT1|nr:MAG: hypothetical protein BTN85_1042 [Candidatus Methanohalarchaeum thermophilum]